MLRTTCTMNITHHAFVHVCSIPFTITTYIPLVWSHPAISTSSVSETQGSAGRVQVTSGTMWCQLLGRVVAVSGSSCRGGSHLDSVPSPTEGLRAPGMTASPLQLLGPRQQSGTVHGICRSRTIIQSF